MHDYDSFNEDVICTLTMAAGEDNVAMVEPMSRHTTFKIGGPADVLVTPETPEGARQRARHLRHRRRSRDGGG